MLTYDLHKDRKESLYFQLYRFIKTDIETGALKAGQRLPSKRALSAHLGISVITVEAALAQLVAEGYVDSIARRGFFVCQIEGTSGTGKNRDKLRSAASAQDRKTRIVNNPEKSTSSVELIGDFSGKTPPVGIFPYTAWARTMRSVLSSENEQTLLSAGDARGSAALRHAIAQHLKGYRGMDVHPDQVVVGSGAQSLYALIIQLLGRDLKYAIENPGYMRLARIYASNDVKLAGISLNAAGPSLSDIKHSDTDVLHCMPSHQFPTGITVPVARRRELLSWAGDPSGDLGRFIIEDDFDCEFRMAGKPIPSLQSLDTSGRVIYTNTFTKTLGAAFRIGYMVLPPKLARKFCDELGFYTCTVGALEQLTLARFIASGEYERHVNRQRTHFRKVLEVLVRELERADSDSLLRFKNVGAGLHFVLEACVDAGENLDKNMSATREMDGEDAKLSCKSVADIEKKIASEALANGVELSPMSEYRMDGPAMLFSADEKSDGERGGADSNTDVCNVAYPQFVMNFASIDETSAPEVARRIMYAINTVIRKA